jgi:hypothetical protein
MIVRTSAVAALILATATPALASTQIAVLGRAPLVGQIASTSQLRADVSQYDSRFTAAGKMMGLTPSEMQAFRREIAVGHPAYVTIPRHLDYMSSSENGRVSVLKDVVIPANERGWEIDLVQKHRIVSLFVPNACGNLSVLVTPVRHIAALPPKTEVAAAHIHRAPLAAAPVIAAVDAPVPVAAPVPPAPVQVAAVNPLPIVAAGHHASFLAPLFGVLGAALIGGAASGGHSGGAVTGISCP